MTETEQRNLQRVKDWEETYNNAVDRMVDELYAPDCEVRNMLAGHVLNGREELRALEHAIEKQVPGRKLRVTKAVASGDTVALECEGIFGDHSFPACVFLTFNAEGQVVSDHTYGAPQSSVDVKPPQ